MPNPSASPFIIFLVHFVIALVAVGILCAIIFVISRRLRKTGKDKYVSFVKEHSTSIKNLNELNKLFVPHKPENFDQKQYYDNETHYFNISCEDYLLYQLQFLQNKIKKEIKICTANQEYYKRYLETANTYKHFGNYTQDCGKLKKDKLIKTEQTLFEKTIIQKPLPFSVYVQLISVNYYGKQLRYPKTQTFHPDEILKLINKLNNRTNGFFNDKDVWDAICRVERGKVSNKVRFRIYERDGYRCQICGKVFNKNHLEIDHIKPIAKGGKSDIENLQTLCHNCNVEKGAKYEE